MATIIWDTWLKQGAEQEGLQHARQVWSDVRLCEGYISHQLFIDQNDPKHIIAPGNWRSEADADAVLANYKDSEVIRQLVPILARPRQCWLTCEDRHS